MCNAEFHCSLYDIPVVNVSADADGLLVGDDLICSQCSASCSGHTCLIAATEAFDNQDEPDLFLFPLE